ncbi:MAG TPA: flagellar biosynthesis protein FlhF [Phycisphaerae bacterium]|nr:flagellar biosynthesis protein FlhF [Phycisphaerae bacterium]
MRLKTYQARSIADALAKVKKDLGRNAVILHTRTLTRGGVLGLGARSIVEITATNDERVMTLRKAVNDGTEELPSPKPSPRLNRAATVRERSPLAAENEFDGGGILPAAPKKTATALPRTELRGLGKIVSDAASNPADARTQDSALHEELTEIRGLVHDLVRRARRDDMLGGLDELSVHYTHLLAQDVAPELAAEVVRRAGKRLIDSTASAGSPRLRLANDDATTLEAIASEIRKVIAEMLAPAAPLRLREDGKPTVVALVGPTGVGKTTTIAKLAANMKLRENKRVGLITIDSYRIAAVEQLKTYAQILRIPIATVLKPGEIRAAIDSMADVDLILIDTAGRSQKDDARVAELGEFLRAANLDQVHLVLSTTSKEKTIREAIDRFGPLGAKHLIFTKLDETEGHGVIFNVLQDASLRLSYLTAGQAVPDDIEIGSASRVARLLMDETVMVATDDRAEKTTKTETSTTRQTHSSPQRGDGL